MFGPKRSFIVASVNGRADSIARFKHGYGRAKIASVDETNEVVRLPSPGRLHVPVSEIPGMEPVIRQLNDFFERFNEIERPPGLVGCGIVIEGAGGAGKTTILDRIAATGWGTIHRITTETKTTGIPLIFDLAIDGQPAIILIDNLPKIIGRSESAERHLVEGFRKLEALAENSQTFPKVVVVASCTNFTQDIPDSLQRSAAFCEFIVIPVPDSRAREEILQHTLGFRLLDDESTRLVRDIATRTHAFTVNDLKTLVRKAYLQAYGRKESPVRLRWDDWERARQQVRPSAMRGVYVKPPDVRWDDIGGQHGLKDLLIEELELHKLDPATVQRRGLRPAKGILMYGPPGCSKTLSAQALATESGFHFIPIKGAELLNMYVGETERGIRDLFKRASMVGPAIIFFDEIDSLASARHNKGVGHDGGGVNTVTTLLTEMDGFETLRGVVILAATNLPWRVDPALLRPGRFDRKVYVPPPDAADRAAIFRTLSRKLQQDAFSKLPSDWPERLAALTVDCSAAQVTDIFASANKMAFRRAPGTKEEKIAQMALTMEDLEACAKACRGSCTAEAVSPYLNFSREHSGDAG